MREACQGAHDRVTDMSLLLRAVSLALVLTACGGGVEPLPALTPVSDPMPQPLTIQGVVDLSATVNPTLPGQAVTMVTTTFAASGEPLTVVFGRATIGPDRSFTLTVDTAALPSALGDVVPMARPAHCTGTYVDTVPFGLRATRTAEFLIRAWSKTVRPTDAPPLTPGVEYALVYVNGPASFERDMTCTSARTDGQPLTRHVIGSPTYVRGWNLARTTTVDSGATQEVTLEVVPMMARLSVVATPVY